MYRDARQWRDIRRRILEKGTPKKRVSAETGISRKTINKMLAHEHPPARLIVKRLLRDDGRL
jgi:lambda repressor-like predicted transcriptional regulator